MSPRNRNDERLPIAPDEEVTRELTGNDATPAEARIGSAGNGASPHGADLTGGYRELEEEPGAADILPDQVTRFDEAVVEEDEHITARPRDRLEAEELEQAAHDRDVRPELSSPDSELP
jgi:hypothetical protein